MSSQNVGGGSGHWAGTRVILRWPYRLKTTLDLGVLVPVARCGASHEKASTASLPQAPYDSTTSGMHVHPSSEHFTWLAECFLSSVATAAAPAADTHFRGKGGVKWRCHCKVKGSRLATEPVRSYDVSRRCVLELTSKSTASFCLGTDAGMMAGLKHYIPELVVPGYSITTTC